MKPYTLRTAPAAKGFSIPYEEELNPQQLAAVTAPGGAVLVIAGAGSGKTRTLTYRVAYLLEKGVNPSRVLLLTFTNKAARQMLHRVETLIRTGVRKIWGGTFHHVANLILRRHAGLLGLRQDYTILDREDAKELMTAAVREAGIDIREKNFPRGAVLASLHSFAVNTQVELPGALSVKCAHFAHLEKEIQGIFGRYEKKKRDLNSVDFDDLLLFLLRLLREEAEVREKYAGRFQHVLVDEYQDTNIIQAEIVDLFASVHGNLMAVGDDAQSIYSFRGAAFRNILSFPERYPGSSVFRVETNYRSTEEILSLANRVVQGARECFPKILVSDRGRGVRPALVPLRNVYQQAEFVAQRILELQDEGVPLPEIAVLYRSHYHSMEIQMELSRREIPFVVRSGLRFFEQAHVKDVLAYLRIVHNPYDEIAWKRAVQLLPRIGGRTAEKIWDHVSASADPLKTASAEGLLHCIPSAVRHLWNDFAGLLAKLRKIRKEGPAEMIRFAVEESYAETARAKFPNAESRLQDLEQLQSYAQQDDTLEAFLSELALIGGLSAEDLTWGEEGEAVILSTVHQAKGLEWRAVFVVWLADGRFPSGRAMEAPEGEEEERRLFYVATTRARDELYLTLPLTVRQRDSMQTLLKPSRYLAELDDSLLEKWSVTEDCF